MGAQVNAAPIIIKRKKVVGGGGHHGGAWKVAYADFVTAMMAFFMLMWLLNATTEQQRKGIADYFSPTIPINRVSGGGNGAFGGEAIFSQENLPQMGTGGLPTRMEDGGASADADPSAGLRDGDAELEAIEGMLMGRGGESLVMENALKHVTTRLTDEGLVIELFELDEARLFAPGTSEPTRLLRDLAAIVSSAISPFSNAIALGAHVSADPIVLAQSPVWSLSADRATAVRELLEDLRLPPRRIRRITGHADREPVLENTMSTRNSRIEIVLLR